MEEFNLLQILISLIFFSFSFVSSITISSYTQKYSRHQSSWNFYFSIKYFQRDFIKKKRERKKSILKIFIEVPAWYRSKFFKLTSKIKSGRSAIINYHFDCSCPQIQEFFCIQIKHSNITRVRQKCNKSFKTLQYRNQIDRALKNVFFCCCFFQIRVFHLCFAMPLCMCITCMPSALKGQKRELDDLDSCEPPCWY